MGYSTSRSKFQTSFINAIYFSVLGLHLINFGVKKLREDKKAISMFLSR